MNGQDCELECSNLLLNSNLSLTYTGSETIYLNQAYEPDDDYVVPWKATSGSPHQAYYRTFLGYTECTNGWWIPADAEPTFHGQVANYDPSDQKCYSEGILQNVTFVNDDFTSYSFQFDASQLNCTGSNNLSNPSLVIRAGNDIQLNSTGISYGLPFTLQGSEVEIVQTVLIDNTSMETFNIDYSPNGQYSQLEFLAILEESEIDQNQTIEISSQITMENISLKCETTALSAINYSHWTNLNLLEFEAQNDSETEFVSYCWDFGDNTTSNEVRPFHTYTDQGKYKVCLSIVDANGCCGTACTDIEIVSQGCDATVTLSGINQISDLVSILSLSNPGDLSSAVAIVEIDGTLEIDVNSVTFGQNLNFLLTPGSSIVVNSSNQLVKNGGFIGPCGNKFEGVIINDGATLDISGVRIWGAETAVKLNVNSILNSTNCLIEDSDYGVYVDGQGTIPTFIGNTIRNCDFGINAENTFELNITEPNNFISCGMGIRYWKTGGSISNNNFQECNFGIFLHKSPISSLIEKNTINAIKTGIAVIKHFVNVRISENEIGGGIVPPLYGVYSENSSVSIEDNISIKATYRGIAAYSPLRLDVSDNELIQVNSNSWNGSGSYGIFVLNDNDGSISSNNISGYMENNIYCISCTETSITGAEILSGATGHSIVMAGGSGAWISLNHILNEPIKGIGIYSHNSGSIIHNSIRAQNTGLFVNDLSQTQAIGCNNFLKGNKDIVTRAILGIQYHHDNEFRKVGSRAFTEGLTQQQAQQSVFIVDDCIVSSATCDRPEVWFRPELFEILEYDSDFPSNYPTDCGNNGDGSDPNNPGPGVIPPNTGPGNDYWCWLFSEFESVENLNSLKSWVLRYKALKLNSLKPDRMIPEDCIPDNDFYCDMDDFIDIENSVKDLRKDVSSGNISYEMMEAGIEYRIADLDILDCNNYIFRLYRNIYRTLLKDMIEEELRSDEVAELRDAAELCAHMYGDVVYWARGILDHRGETTTYDDVTCESEWSEDPKSRNEKVYANDQILVSPNPAGNFILLENKTNFDVLQVKVTDSFGRIYEVSENLENQMKIDCSSYSSSIYFITITHSSGYHTVKRVVVTK